MTDMPRMPKAKSRVRYLAWLSPVVVVLCSGYVYLAGSVDKDLTSADLDAIGRLPVGAACADTSTFEAELACIRQIQTSIRTLVPDFTCADRSAEIEPSKFLQRGFGCCYDRARFTEKALAYFGFETRHVAIFDRDAYGFLGLLVPGISSHATSEVKTRKGWMGVDSNEPFLLLTREGDVLTYRNFKLRSAEVKDPVTPADFYERNLIVVYGLFSRHGRFHGVNLPTPEFNFRELFYNFSSS